MWRVYWCTKWFVCNKRSVFINFLTQRCKRRHVSQEWAEVEAYLDHPPFLCGLHRWLGHRCARQMLVVAGIHWMIIDVKKCAQRRNFQESAGRSAAGMRNIQQSSEGVCRLWHNGRGSPTRIGYCMYTNTGGPLLSLLVCGEICLWTFAKRKETVHDVTRLWWLRGCDRDAGLWCTVPSQERIYYLWNAIVRGVLLI